MEKFEAESLAGKKESLKDIFLKTLNEKLVAMEASDEITLELANTKRKAAAEMEEWKLSQDIKQVIKDAEKFAESGAKEKNETGEIFDKDGFKK